MRRGHARHSGDERATVIYRGDDDALSTRSYDTDDSLGGDLEKRCAALKIDGRSPEVLYSLSVWRRGRVVEYESSKPFSKIPGPEETSEDVVLVKDGRGPRTPGGNHKDGMPVLEIHASIDQSNPFYAPVRRTRASRRYTPPVPPRPVTMAFDRLDGYADPFVEDDYDLSRGGDFSLRYPEMTVLSAHLVNALRAVVKYYPGLNLGEQSISFDAPYEALFHHRRELAVFRDNQPSCHGAEYAATTAKHIDILLRVLEHHEPGHAIHQEEQLHKLPLPAATFENYWLLLKPGSVVYAKTNDIWGAYVVSRVSRTVGSKEPYSVACWYLEYDGSTISRYMVNFNILPWSGEQAISTLSVVPAEYWVDDLTAQGGLTMREKQIQEGKLYWELVKSPTHLEHRGHLLASFETGSNEAAEYSSSRVVCDAAGFLKYYDSAPESSPYRLRSPRLPARSITPSMDTLPRYLPRCGCEACRELTEPAGKSRYVGIEGLDPMQSAPPIDDLVYMVCKKSMPAFILSTLQWGHVHLQNLKPVNINKDSFKDLIVDEHHKNMVKALLEKLTIPAEGKICPWDCELVKQKGGSRIFLLHGRHGLGKSSTIECAAEMTGRPLMTLLPDDRQATQDLPYYLRFAQRYGAFVVFKDLDNLIEKRGHSFRYYDDYIRKLLPLLDTYRGVVFLSTSSVRRFDPEILARVHVALHYKDISDQDRERIWLSNFDRVTRETAGAAYVSSAAQAFIWGDDDLRALKWGGREIRNAVQTALTLAETEAQQKGSDSFVIQEEHLKAVVDMRKSFAESSKRRKTTRRHSRRCSLVHSDGDSDSDSEAGSGSDSGE
ncbi:hypothetical protein S40293_03868 [Stachybotrys chartarum IBT 40293]|nr:hypothetical protein S40293_03868 [Stachybotrys chartarum IBT 40293]